MKNFAITVTHPAFANMLVEAATKEEAIEKVRAMLEAGTGVNFEVDVDDPTQADIFAVELTGEKSAEDAERYAPNLRQYTVLLEATSYKEVPLRAASAEAAMQLAHEMYFRTDALDFNDGDVEHVTATVIEGESEDEQQPDLKVMLLTELLQMIRATDASDSVVAGILKSGLDVILAAKG